MTLPRISLYGIAGLGVASTSTILNPGAGFIPSLWPGLIAVCIITYNLIDLQALRHSEKIRDGIWIIHWKANLLRIAVAVLVCCILHAYYFNIAKILDLLVFAACWFGGIFNAKLNRYRGLHPLYVGKNDKKDGLLDRIFSSLPYGGLILLLLELIGVWLSATAYLS